MSRFFQNAGYYRHPIDIEVQTEVENDYGEKTQTWATFIHTRAGINPISGREYLSAEQVNSETTHKINLRYVPGLTPAMRVNFNGRIFKIVNIQNYYEKHTDICLMCKEVI